MTERQRLALIVTFVTVGLLGGAVAAWLDVKAFCSAWLPAAFWLLDMSLGALLARWLFDIAGGTWGERALPAMQLCASALPLGLIAALFVSWIARRQLPWLTAPQSIPALFLSEGAFALRALLYAAGWLALASVSGVWRSGVGQRRPRLGALALIVHLPLATLLAVDGFASLQPEWYSTALGLGYISSQAVAGFAAITLLQCSRTPRTDEQPLRDLGTLLFASIVFWFYIELMQFLIIWSGDLPREISWYLDRSSGGWIAVLCVALGLKLVLPGALLLSRRLKSDVRWLGGIAAVVLLGHLFDLIWQMSPAIPSGVALRGLLVLAAVAGLGGCWLLIVLHSNASHRYVVARSAS